MGKLDAADLLVKDNRITNHSSYINKTLSDSLEYKSTGVGYAKNNITDAASNMVRTVVDELQSNLKQDDNVAEDAASAGIDAERDIESAFKRILKKKETGIKSTATSATTSGAAAAEAQAARSAAAAEAQAASGGVAEVAATGETATTSSGTALTAGGSSAAPTLMIVGIIIVAVLLVIIEVVFMSMVLSSAGAIASNTGFYYPLETQRYISSPYGEREPMTIYVAGYGYVTTSSFHSGIDFPEQIGANVLASANGTVVVARDLGVHGNYIGINHEDGYSTAYYHLNEILCEAGDEVVAGQVIGTVGSTGVSTGPHLHFGIIQDGHSIDPTDMLRELGEE